MAVSDLLDMAKFRELRRNNPIKAKNLMKKIKKKNAKKTKKEKTTSSSNRANENKGSTSSFISDAYVEYVEEDIDKGLLENFEDVYNKFRLNTEDSENQDENSEEEKKGNLLDGKKDEKIFSLHDGESDETDTEGEINETEGTKGKNVISRKALKLLRRPSVIKLKEFAKNPELVEVWDTTANDPFFFVWLKCLKNSVPVPQQWCQKKKYMHAKRGIEKLPYKLPPYIEDTKISEIRQSIKEKEEQKSLKQKMRDRVRPKLHTMDIDYQTLHDAFFKYSKKPKLVKFADVYYEGKEFELKTKKFRPGMISEKLRKALNIEPNDPLPWLYNMKKYGLPPSFPYLDIPSLHLLSAESASPGGDLNAGGGIAGAANAGAANAGAANAGAANAGSGNTVGGNMGSGNAGSGNIGGSHIDESGNIIYGNFVSQRANEGNNRYADDFLWGEIDERYEEDEDDNEEEEEGGGEGEEDGGELIGGSDDDIDGEHGAEKSGEKRKVTSKDKKDKNEHMDMDNVNINFNDNMNDDMLKNNYASGIYSVVTNSKMTGSYTPYMESGLNSVDLTSFVSGYETPKYVYANGGGGHGYGGSNSNSYGYGNNARSQKPYTVLHREEVPMTQGNLFSSQAQYKINPGITHMSRQSNASEGVATPFTSVGINTPHAKSEGGRSEGGKGMQSGLVSSNVEDIRKELNKFEEISNKAKLVSAQVDPPKKPKKDEKKKKKKKFSNFNWMRGMCPRNKETELRGKHKAVGKNRNSCNSSRCKSQCSLNPNLLPPFLRS
ncbi:splicing factor 3B subunit 2, putative [Plasmodium ovale]|uniref:Splicing factor 3B subunit 2, putative n=1 Tax=Plasmodium ovale TaxID=36330 RepID=A0A1D3TL36_PLAOA|nr:splicing factor 3B subunit 2, putative [Plasmodium ovale]